MAQGCEPRVSLPSLPRTALVDVLCAVLSPVAVVAFGRASREALAHSRDDEVWGRLLRQAFPESAAPGRSPRLRLRDLAYGDGSTCRCAQSCRGSLLQPRGGRCPCVARRARLPLRLGQLQEARSGTSSLTCGGFSSMLAELGRHFAAGTAEGGPAVVTDLASLSEDSLREVDVLFVCATEGPPLAPAEVAAMRRWVEAGGALILSAFAASALGDLAQATVEWLGVRPAPAAACQPGMVHRVEACFAFGGRFLDAFLEGDVGALLRGPFGGVASFANKHETVFDLHGAFDCGAVQLTKRFHGCDLLERGKANLLFYPPWPLERGGVTGRGRVLVCANFHWLADLLHWDGGLFHVDDNAKLLCNFVGSALAARGSAA